MFLFFFALMLSIHKRTTRNEKHKQTTKLSFLFLTNSHSVSTAFILLYRIHNPNSCAYMGNCCQRINDKHMICITQKEIVNGIMEIITINLSDL